MDIQQFLTDYARTRKLNGTILIATGDHVVAEQNFGFADFNAKTPCQRNTQYQIGSVTKQFTAAATLKALYNLAIDAGSQEPVSAVKSLLNKPIVYFLPENLELWANNMPHWAQDVTVHQLLQHSSGIPSYTSFTEYREKFFSSPPDQLELIGYFKNKELKFSPGSMFEYCNSGYILLGAIVEQLVKQSLSKYLEQNFFKPWALHDTYFPMQGTVKDLKLDAKFAKLALGYEFDVTAENPQISEIKRYLPMQIAGAAGAMISNVTDLLLWNNALFSGKVVPHFLVEFMQKSTISTGEEDGAYGYGLECKNSKSLGSYYFHGGGIEGYKSMLAYIPKLNMSIICLTNLMPGGEQFSAEVDKLNATMPPNLPDQEKSLQLKESLQRKFPLYAKNRELYNATLFCDALISELESNKNDIM